MCNREATPTPKQIELEPRDIPKLDRDAERSDRGGEKRTLCFRRSYRRATPQKSPARKTAGNFLPEAKVRLPARLAQQWQPTEYENADELRPAPQRNIGPAPWQRGHAPRS